MDCGFKRKLDCISDVDVFAPHTSQQTYENFMMDQAKRVKLSIQLGAASQSDCGSFIGSETPTEAWSLQCNRNCANNESDDMDMEERCDRGDQEDMSEDIPTTTEVINSLRKVILWMSAQDDHNNDYIQYLTDVEHYAMSKQPNVQQRKITQYFIRQD